MSSAAGVAGLLVLAAAWAGPLPAMTTQSFTAHMVLHMLIVAVAAPLLATGLAGGRFDPVRRAPGLFSPLPASGLEFLTVWAWHAPVLHHAALLHAGVFAGEQVTFLVSGLWLWLAVLGGAAPRRASVALPGLAALALTVAHTSLLGVLLSLSPRPLYTHGRALTANALHDQQLGAAVMLVAIGGACVLGALVLGRRMVQSVARTGLESA